MNRLTIVARSAARQVGLLRLIQRTMPTRSYEKDFGDALLGVVRPGDTVWDVGANVGFYTRQLLERVGPGGRVVAFEPEPSCNHILKRECPGATVVNVALGDREQSAFIEFHGEPKNGTHCLVQHPSSTSSPVRVLPGDSFSEFVPNVIKIDVEGFEEDVLKGMPGLLSNHKLRAVFLEVHFSLLEKRGQPMAPLRIEERLRSLGFRTRWLRDRSHLTALR